MDSNLFLAAPPLVAALETTLTRYPKVRATVGGEDHPRLITMMAVITCSFKWEKEEIELNFL